MPRLTWKLWRSLRHPPTRNPVFRRAYVMPAEPMPLVMGCAELAGMILFVPIIAFAALIYGTGWCAGISQVISRERARGTFELLGLTPPGPMGMSWALALGHLYRQARFRNINQTANVMTRAVVMGVLIASVGMMFDLASENTLTSFGLRIVTLTTALVIDHLQSIVLAVLVGILAGQTRSPFNARLYAFAGYIGLQLVTYLVMFAVGFSILPPLLNGWGIDGSMGEMILLSARLLILYGVREIGLLLLWRTIRDQLNPDPQEVRVLEQGAR